MQDLKVLTKEEKDGLDVPRISEDQETSNSFGKKVYIESYGCAMNFADSEVVTSILQENGYVTTSNVKEAHTILLNTCAIRENAEMKVWHRLKYFQSLRRKNRVSKKKIAKKCVTTAHIQSQSKKFRKM
jgi:tRNA-2-methylthio-N6-dimethylallyladenosine synthase